MSYGKLLVPSKTPRKPPIEGDAVDGVRNPLQKSHTGSR